MGRFENITPKKIGPARETIICGHIIENPEYTKMKEKSRNTKGGVK